MGNHIVRGNNHIVIPRAAFQKGIEGFVALGCLVVDGNPGFFLELCDKLLVDILAPTAHVYHRMGIGGAGKQNDCGQKSSRQDPGPAPLNPSSLRGRESHGNPFRGTAAAGGVGSHALQTGLPEVGDHQKQQDCHKEQGGDSVDFRRYPFLSHAIDGHSQGRGRRTRGEIADNKIIYAHGKGCQRAGDDAGLDFRQNHFPECLHPGTAQVLSGVHQILVHLPQLWAYRENDVGNIEGNMGNQQRAEAQGQPGGKLYKMLHAVEPVGEITPESKKGYKEQAHRHTGDNISIHHGNIVHRVQKIPLPPPETVEPDSGEGPGKCGNRRGKQGHQQGCVDAPEDQPIMQQLPVPVQGKAGPDDIAVPGVEGKDNQQKNRRVEKHEHQGGKHPAQGRIPAFHSITACSSPSPKRFMTTIHTTTITIITREMAAPS